MKEYILKDIETVKAKISSFQVMAVTALANITNSAVNAGKKFVSAFFDDASLPKLLVGLLCCECGRAAEICRSAIEEWRVMFEVAALRLSPRSGGQTELSQAAIPIILGFAAAQAEPQAAQKAATEALAALILKK